MNANYYLIFIFYHTPLNSNTFDAVHEYDGLDLNVFSNFEKKKCTFVRFQPIKPSGFSWT